MTPADYQRIANQYGAARLYHHAAAWSQLAACLAICGPSAALTEAEEHAQAGRLVDAFDAISRAAKTPTVVGGDQ
ncbi:MAG: hypothetical protein HOY76_08410 [Streptomyces sp.]|nr:hypothetical protein [Streptomyces sp.]